MRTIAIALMLLAATLAWAVDVQNTGFDGIARTTPEGWEAPGEAAQVFAVNDADGVSGSTSLQYSSQAGLDETFIEQAVTLVPRTEYVLSAWFKSDGTTRPLVAVLQPGERNFMARVDSDGSQAWQQARVRFNSGPVTDALIRVYGDFGPGRSSRAGEARIDDARIVLASEVAQEGPPIAGGFAGPPPGENIALGKSYTWNTAPRYALCTDPNDITQLTDGEHTVGYFWTQQPTVGWILRNPVELTIDLERVEPITGVSFNTAGGVASVGFPSMIFVLTSSDGENFDYHGELIALSAEHGLPAPQTYVVHRYATDRLKAAARYVRFVVAPGSQYLFCDEVEVYRGDFAVADASPGQPVESSAQLMDTHRLDGIVGTRQMNDIQELQRRVAGADVPHALKRELNARLDSLADEVRAQHVTEVEHWKGLPYNDLHARIYAVNAPLLRAQGHDELTVWPARRWDMLDPMGAPQPGEVAINVLRMRGEYRSAAFNITNLSDEPVTARIIGGPQVHEVQYVQTQEREITSNALPLAATDDAGAALIEIPAGLTKQVWLTFADAGPQAENIEVHIGGERVALIPVTEEIVPIDMPRPPVSVTCWDYVGDTVSYAPGFTDLDAMAADLESHFVDAPWCNSSVIPWPADGTIDAEGHITRPMDFGRLDRWIARFPNARTFLMYAALNSGDFRGTALGSERWATALGEWATLLTDHLREQGVPPERWAMLIVDEPGAEKQEQIITDVANAMKAAVPELQVFEDPTRPDPAAALPEMYDVSDILCPNVPRLFLGGQRGIDFYGALREADKDLWVYQCAGPHKLLDPITYHRHNFWHAWNVGATGVGYWGYVDSAGTGSSWDNFKGGGTSYSLVYADDQNHLATSKQWEAVREGAEDYTVLWMLREAIAEHEGAETDAVRNARELLETLPGEVTGGWNPGSLRWVDERDRTTTDAAREQLLRALMALR